MKVLVVDDHEDNVDLICAILEDRHELLTANSGPQCLELALTETPDLILLDVHMPRMNGYEAFQQLKSRPETRDIHVIFVSAAYRDTDRIVMGLDLGAHDYLVKPIDDDLLTAKVNAVERIIAAEKAVLEHQKRLEEANERLTEAIRIKSDFLAMMSHEIRTPVNGIVISLDLLKETDLSAGQLELLSGVEISGKSLLELLNQLLDFSKLETRGVELEILPFSLEQTIVGAMDQFTLRAKEKSIKLELQSKDESSGYFMGDSFRLGQVIVNLVSNAVKFTSEGGVTVDVGSKRTEDGQWEITVHVKDTGIGIPEGKFERLFKPFSQADASTLRRYGGTGLGLVICQRLIESMGGKIWFHSMEEKGSIFSFQVVFPEVTED